MIPPPDNFGKPTCMNVAESLATFLVDPVSRDRLHAEGTALVNPSRGVSYTTDAHGYYDFTVDRRFHDMETTSEEYAGEQQASWQRFYEEYLRPWAFREPVDRVLEVGCGMGLGIRMFREDGLEAYGIDIPCLARFWGKAGNNPLHFFLSDGAATPFPDDCFDAVYTLGTIEHIGTSVGHYTLEDDYQETRGTFARELLRITRPGGRILVTCPNKSFPIDIHHEPTDAATPPGTMRFRRYLFDRFGMTLHRPFGRYHLLSFSELRRLFCVDNGASAIEALPLKNYFAFKRTGSLRLVRALKVPIISYIERMPPLLRRSPFNPFLVVEIRK
jgi:SAM-dependent methyltransferase